MNIYITGKYKQNYLGTDERRGKMESSWGEKGICSESKTYIHMEMALFNSVA